MQGAVYTLFADMVTEESGVGCWNTLLDAVQPISRGAYTAGATYDDNELIALVNAYAAFSQRTPQQVQRGFGQYLFKPLYAQLAGRAVQFNDLFSFLDAIGTSIHREVTRITPQATPPQIVTQQLSALTLRLHYRSERQLCLLCEGLILGAADHFRCPVTLQHQQCMHTNASSCVIDITKLSE